MIDRYLFVLLFAFSALAGNIPSALKSAELSTKGNLVHDILLDGISEDASEEELFSMAAQATPERKVAIGKELVDRKSSRITDLFRLYLNPNEMLHITEGGLEYDSSTAAELYRAIAYQKEKAERREYYERTTKNSMKADLEALFGPDYDTKWSIEETEVQMASLTQIALHFDAISSETLNTILRFNGFKDNNYQRIKFFAQKYPTREILATLANFKNTSDLLLLQQNIDNAYIAVSLFPHPSLFPFLKTHIATNAEDVDYQTAVTAYKNEQSRTLLENICTRIKINNTVKTERDEKLFQLYSCIEKQDYKPYLSVLKKIDGLLK